MIGRTSHALAARPAFLMRLASFARAACSRTACASLLVAGMLCVSLAAAGDARAAGVVTLGVDQATVLRLAKPASTIILGNPLIADASVQDSRTLVLTGRSFGITNIIVLDTEGAEVLNTQLSVSAGASGSHQVTLHRATSRMSLSCTPECEQAPMVGDDADLFDRLTTQITTRNALSTPD